MGVGNQGRFGSQTLCTCLVTRCTNIITTSALQQACRVHSRNMKGLARTREHAARENTFKQKNRQRPNLLFASSLGITSKRDNQAT